MLYCLNFELFIHSSAFVSKLYFSPAHGFSMTITHRKKKTQEKLTLACEALR